MARSRVGNPQPGVPVVPPAPPQFGRVLPIRSVAAGAVADPQGRRPRIVAAARARLAGADGHEAVVSLQRVRVLQQPEDALCRRQGHPVGGHDLLPGFGGGGVLKLVSPPRILQPVPAVRQGDRRGVEAGNRHKVGRVDEVLHDEAALAAATKAPAASIGEATRGDLTPGMAADIAVFTAELQPAMTFVGGAQVWRA
ncbi:hypothetical protein SDC9_174902 [bioreactor metagenome]|uniref:Uncharacterized protein n=1 Tax=bioreactor metagenome TaxID=1076179 RepID=A0A645GKL1_9ZZZZ